MKNNKKNDIICPMADLFLLPVAKLIMTSEASSSFNYLPYESSDPENLAWIYYHKELEKIEKDICSYRDYFGDRLYKMLELLSDIKKYISSFEGVDGLPNYWFAQNQKMGILSGQFQFAFRNVLNNEVVEMLAGQEPTYVLETFVSFIMPMCTDKEQKDIERAVKERNVNVGVTPEEKEELRKLSIELKQDIHAKVIEGMNRKKYLETLCGKSNDKPLSERALELKRRIEVEDGNIVYHIIEDDKRIILLTVTDERLYWDNQWPACSRLGVFAFGYAEYLEKGQQNGYGVVHI